METPYPNAPGGPGAWSHLAVRRGAGALVIVGGGGTPPAAHDLFFHLAGGAEARVVHIPSATRTFEEIPDKRAYYCEFYGRNPASFAFLHTYDRAVAEREEFAAPLRDATGVWIGGGTQGRLAELFLGTRVVPAIHRVLARGGVVAGTSSGAAIMSDAMIRSGYEEIEFGRGFALYPRAIVDPHFTGRRREKRVARAVLRRPNQIAVGVDEQTALVVQDDRLGVIGASSAWFHFADGAAGKVYRYRLRAGEMAELGVAVRAASPRVLEDCLRALRPADVIAAGELAPELDVV
jgi:cyanophycinase